MRLAAGDIAAVFRPAQGMLCASLTHRGAEILRRIEDIDAAEVTGATVGVPLLHPWANRLPSTRYRAAGQAVALDPESPLLHFDRNGLPIHGVPWARLRWNVIESRPDRLVAALDWNRPELLALFPFPHWLRMTAALQRDGLRIETTLVAGAAGPVPASFGFHPYVGLSGAPRAQWRLQLPAMRRLVLDDRALPTGVETFFGAVDEPLGEHDFDDGFALLGEQAAFSIAAAGRRITLEFLAGFTHAQVYAPADQDFIAFEPMTAPTAALASGRGLRLVAPGRDLSTAFDIRVAVLA
jgi:aldose 1-epimerase